MTRLFTFIGVTTGGSSIMRIFPRWRDALRLGADVEMVGWDLPVDAPEDVYRDAIRRLRDDPANLGALVTTHKIGVYLSARELFDRLDGNAELCEEVSCIAKRDGQLAGWAKDPVAAGLCLEAMLAADHFATAGGEVLCMGAGGSGVAIAVHLALRRQDRPRRIVVTDISQARLARLDQIATRARIGDTLELVASDSPGGHEGLLPTLPPGSLLINATGMGKDRPGSPLSERAVLPERAIVWELNYRGELEFLRQAQAQQDERGLVVEDGWRYFIRGWTSVMEEVFDRQIGEPELELLTREAEFARPPIDG